jgi:hypothetical protein
MTLKNATAKVKIGDLMKDPYNTDSAFRQNDAQSATFFNIALHEAVKDPIKTRNIVNKTWQISTYAYDLVIIYENI